MRRLRPAWIVLLLLLGGCDSLDLQGQVSGSGGKADGTGTASRATFGFHLLPQISDDEDFHRVAEIGQWAVLNVPVQFWRGPEASRMLAAIDACDRHGLRCIVRLEDQDIVSTAPADRRRAADAAWLDKTFLPYLREVVGYGRGKIWGYQVLNEPWYAAWQVLGPGGSALSPSGYVDLLARARVAILGVDPAARVLMAGLVGIDGESTAARARSLVQLGVLKHSDLFNFHYYSDGKFPEHALKRIREVAGLVGEHPAIITECNHLQEHHDDYGKFTTLKSIWRHAGASFRDLRAHLAFVWRSPGGGGWQIRGSRLEQLLIGEYASKGSPRGHLDSAGAGEISGWALDPDVPTAPIDVHIYVDNSHLATVRADRPRLDLEQVYPGVGWYHGFHWTPPMLGPGTHRVDVFAINVPAGVNPPIGTAYLVR